MISAHRKPKNKNLSPIKSNENRIIEDIRHEIENNFGKLKNRYYFLLILLINSDFKY